MKKILWTKYGKPEVLKLAEVEKPAPKNNEVLIKVHAASVTAGDCELRAFTIPLPGIFWLPLRLILGITRPRKNTTLGQEFSGTIEQVGKDVKNWKVGDQVFGGTGMRLSAYAEYRTHKASYPMAHKPQNMSYLEATTLPVGGLNSLHFMRLAKVKPGQSVLVYGATGSIGTYAVQVAKYMGADVTAVCSTPNMDMVRSLGADRVIDYTKENFWELGDTYDVIFEAVGKSPYFKGLSVIKPNGVFLLANPKGWHLFRARWDTWTSSKRVIWKFADDNKSDLDKLKELAEAGHIRAVIDRTYDLEDMIEAHKYVELGQKAGHVVVKIA